VPVDLPGLAPGSSFLNDEILLYRRQTQIHGHRHVSKNTIKTI
jgi:hypothetical protein